MDTEVQSRDITEECAEEITLWWISSRISQCWKVAKDGNGQSAKQESTQCKMAIRI